MAAIIIIAVLVYIFFAVTKKKEPITPQKTYKPETKTASFLEKQKADRELLDKVITDIKKENHIKVKELLSASTQTDDSIIDITNHSYKINSLDSLKKYDKGVPYWAHQYIYSYTEINQATNEQKLFYRIFKSNFLSEHFFDLEGNTNYAFILMFDLLDKYEHHKDISRLEYQLKNLGQHYPKTRSYSISFLLKKMKQEGYDGEVFRVMEENEHYDSEYWRLGSKYKDKLKLSNYEVKLLNDLVDTINKFNSIEFCAVELIRLVLNCKYYLEEYYKKNSTSFENVIREIAHQEISSRYRYKEGTYNYKNTLDNFNSTVYQCLYKTCENALRDYLKVGRKTDLTWYLHSESSKTLLKVKVLDIIQPFLEKSLSELGEIDLESEIEINNYSRSRYKNELKLLSNSLCMENLSSYDEAIEKLLLRNSRNPYIENIYYEASRFMANYDKSLSLNYYIKYLYLDLQSAAFDNKQFTKTMQKSLFKTNEQLHDFEQIVSDLIKDRDLDRALKSVPKIYEVKRKKITLDKSAIKEVQQQHSGTVELLNEYLQDDFEDENNSIQSQEINSEEIKIEIISKGEESLQSMFLNHLSLNSIQISILGLFSKNNFSILQSDIEEFAKSKGVFKNQVIESINEACYDVLDDVLIEEEDDYYTIIPDYFHKISAK